MTDSAEELIGSEMTGLLSGLAPQLVFDLANLEGSTLDDLQVTMQVAPFGDRATLQAYGCLEKEEGHVVVLPKLLEVIAAAHVLVDSIIKDIPRLLSE